MKYRIVYSITDSKKRQSIETYLCSVGFRPQLPFSSMTATLEDSISELKRKLKKLRNACLLSPKDTLVLICEEHADQRQLLL